jgi:glycosyltransferase involved in cell wall biosynthesis
MAPTLGGFKDISMPIKTTALWITKNSAKFIGYSIASVLCFIDQAIVIDDESTDRTRDVVLALKSPKVQLSISNTNKYNMDWNVCFAMSHTTGQAIIFLDDDYVWDNHNASRVQDMMQKASNKGLWGVDLDCYNVIRPNQYLPPKKGTPDLVFNLPSDRVIVGGSFYTDNNQMVHQSEARGFRHGKQILKKKHINYLHCGLRFTHWKYVKDTREEFIKKLEIFLKMSVKEAEGKWSEIYTRPTLLYPYSLPEVFYEYRDLFVPLGGFDIVRWEEECGMYQKNSVKGDYNAHI